MNYEEIYNIEKYQKEFNKINFNEYKLVKAKEMSYIKKFYYEHKTDPRYTLIEIKFHAGNIRRINLYFNNEKHSDNGPAMFKLHCNELIGIEYWTNGKLYNPIINEPSEIEFNNLNKLKLLRFTNKNGQINNIDAPAELYFYDGSRNEYYFINGFHYNKEKYYNLINKVKNQKIHCNKYKKENLIIIREIAEHYQMKELLNKIDNRLLIEFLAEK